MHQPSYLDPGSDRFELPWVRLHGCKDYRDLLERHAEYGVPCTLNVVPSLIEQLGDLVAGHRTDRYLELSSKPTGALNAGERRFVCDHSAMGSCAI
jgi:alpha-amylase/alpha-mannosidase (GH57 family)